MDKFGYTLTNFAWIIHTGELITDESLLWVLHIGQGRNSTSDVYRVVEKKDQ
jgi:hypothetical protein